MKDEVGEPPPRFKKARKKKSMKKGLTRLKKSLEIFQAKMKAKLITCISISAASVDSSEKLVFRTSEITSLHEVPCTRQYPVAEVQILKEEAGVAAGMAVMAVEDPGVKHSPKAVKERPKNIVVRVDMAQIFLADAAHYADAVEKVVEEEVEAKSGFEGVDPLLLTDGVKQSPQSEIFRAFVNEEGAMIERRGREGIPNRYPMAIKAEIEICSRLDTIEENVADMAVKYEAKNRAATILSEDENEVKIQHQLLENQIAGHAHKDPWMPRHDAETNPRFFGTFENPMEIQSHTDAVAYEDLEQILTQEDIEIPDKVVGNESKNRATSSVSEKITSTQVATEENTKADGRVQRIGAKNSEDR